MQLLPFSRRFCHGAANLIVSAIFAALFILVCSPVHKVAAQQIAIALPCSFKPGPSGGMSSYISEKYEALGGAHSFLGNSKSSIARTPDGIGCFEHFEGGSIYWSPQTGAHEVHGAIKDKWANLGWEKFFGYPSTDETPTPDGAGRYNHFQGGSIYWTPQTGAHEAHGAIRDKWASLGWEKSFLGYPRTDEVKSADGVGRYSRFQGGSIYWSLPTGAYEVHGSQEAERILPQGLTGGIAYVNHSCSVSVASWMKLAGSAIGIAAGCATGGGCIGAVAGAAANVVGTVSGSSFLECGPPNVFVSGGVIAEAARSPAPTLLLAPDGSAVTVHAANGWLTMSDGDKGNNKDFGFYHQELRASGGGIIQDLAASENFILPRGTACGFHHTQNTPLTEVTGESTSSCMGQDPAYGQCPKGWAAKSHFDMGSGDGTGPCGNLERQSHCGYFTWCEYQDPHGLCDSDPQCLARARANGYALGISSNTDDSGVESGVSKDEPACPEGFSRTHFYDDQRSPGQGLSWCLPTPDLPQGLTGAIVYSGGFAPPYWNPAQASYVGFVDRFDGDVQAQSGNGFFHLDLVSGGLTDPGRSDSFKLLPGTACGFHHTLNSRGLTCMGFDPATGNCPKGWVARGQFDMGSGDGQAQCGNLNSAGEHCHYWAWCEYQDPHGLCSGPHYTECEIAARYNLGYTTGISSNVEDAGVAGFPCPAAWTQSPYFDKGRGEGQGVSWCGP